MSQWKRDTVDILRRAGVEVVGMKYEQGPYVGMTWKQVGFNGQGYSPGVLGIMWHHDGSPAGDSPGALWWMMYGAKDTDGTDLTPAASAWVDRYGKWHVYAAGKTNHAGRGNHPLSGPDNGNAVFYGIETDHTTGEAWPAAQLRSLRLGTAALCLAWGLRADAVTFHKTYAPGRKNDPDGLDLAKEVRAIRRAMRRLRLRQLLGPRGA